IMEHIDRGACRSWSKLEFREKWRPQAYLGCCLPWVDVEEPVEGAFLWRAHTAEGLENVDCLW
ncbi:hypothetical protein U1Q18_019699, partial [Sarracenia purpurea var. burkii]